MNIGNVSLTLVLAFVISGCASTTSSGGDVMVEVAPSSAESESAAEPAESAAAAQAPEADGDDPDEVICKKLAKTGTRVKSTVCATRAEWEDAARRGKEATYELQRRPHEGPGPG